MWGGGGEWRSRPQGRQVRVSRQRRGKARRGRGRKSRVDADRRPNGMRIEGERSGESAGAIAGARRAKRHRSEGRGGRGPQGWRRSRRNEERGGARLGERRLRRVRMRSLAQRVRVSSPAPGRRRLVAGLAALRVLRCQNREHVLWSSQRVLATTLSHRHAGSRQTVVMGQGWGRSRKREASESCARNAGLRREMQPGLRVRKGEDSKSCRESLCGVATCVVEGGL
eukprot:5705822-Pleurochrysis_carterae.AAC.2